MKPVSLGLVNGWVGARAAGKLNVQGLGQGFGFRVLDVGLSEVAGLQLLHHERLNDGIKIIFSLGEVPLEFGRRLLNRDTARGASHEIVVQ